MNGGSGNDTFHSILWPDAVRAAAACAEVALPDCFHDLNLDQVEDAIAQAWPGEDLAPFFRTPLGDCASVEYRQAVLRDLDAAAWVQAVTAFVLAHREVRARLAAIDKLHYRCEKEHALLGAAARYIAAVQNLRDGLGRLAPTAAGWCSLHAYLVDYTAGAAFAQLRRANGDLLQRIGEIRYDLLIRSNSVTVRAADDAADASADVAATFAKFQPGAATVEAESPHARRGSGGLNHVEAQVLERVALLNPKTFAALDAFCAAHAAFVDPVIARFAREVCFYLAWLCYIEPMRHAGLAFCQPKVAIGSQPVAGAGGFDVALAAALARDGRAPVCNDFSLAAGERIVVVTGPNHGGKTTFARMLGQLHWLAALGLSVPGTQARVCLFDRLFTHFARAEKIETLRGKLKDDLCRLHAILAAATPRSVIILNEIFASTTLADAVWLGRRMMARIERLGALAVCVTFLTELAEGGAATVSMVAAVDPDDPAIRTFSVQRRPADGLAYALAVAQKYGVARAALLQRIAPCKRC